MGEENMRDGQPLLRGFSLVRELLLRGTESVLQGLRIYQRQQWVLRSWQDVFVDLVQGQMQNLFLSLLSGKALPPSTSTPNPHPNSRTPPHHPHLQTPEAHNWSCWKCRYQIMNNSKTIVPSQTLIVLPYQPYLPYFAWALVVLPSSANCQQEQYNLQVN